MSAFLKRVDSIGKRVDVTWHDGVVLALYELPEIARRLVGRAREPGERRNADLDTEPGFTELTPGGIRHP